MHSPPKYLPCTAMKNLQELWYCKCSCNST